MQLKNNPVQLFYITFVLSKVKKYNFTYRLISFCLAVLIYVSSAGVVLGKHHCKMQAQNLETICAKTGCKKGCCSTEFQHFQLDQDQQTNSFNLEISKPLSHFVIAFVGTFLIEKPNQKQISTYEQYKPPLIFRDIPVFIQSFLF